MKNVSCEKCEHWASNPDTNGENGRCRRSPPVNHPVMVESIRGPQMGFQALWPMTGKNEWCGEFKAYSLQTLN